jgi:hypothetical protein
VGLILRGEWSDSVERNPPSVTSIKTLRGVNEVMRFLLHPLFPPSLVLSLECEIRKSEIICIPQQSSLTPSFSLSFSFSLSPDKSQEVSEVSAVDMRRVSSTPAELPF